MKLGPDCGVHGDSILQPSVTDGAQDIKLNRAENFWHSLDSPPAL